MASRFLFFEHEGNRAVRMAKWKLVAAHGEAWQLHDMEADRTEMHDVSAEHPGLRARMIELFYTWAERCAVQPWPLRRRDGYEPPKRVYPETWVDLGA